MFWIICECCKAQNGDRKTDYMFSALRSRFICGLLFRPAILSGLRRSSGRYTAESASVCSSQPFHYLSFITVQRCHQAYDWFIFDVSNKIIDSN